jgi:hypothetical protein
VTAACAFRHIGQGNSFRLGAAGMGRSEKKRRHFKVFQLCKYASHASTLSARINSMNMLSRRLYQARTFRARPLPETYSD